ncbi:MAG: hypothetical protein J6575_03720 [Bifidobacterium sp.]|nr:hypothetical protein [Bifidobacterium sp.]
MVSKKEFRPLSPFATAFAVEYKSWMRGHDVTLQALADHLGRTAPYVQERVSGKRALDTLDIDALAELTNIQPRDLMIELSKRTKQTMFQEEQAALADKDARIARTMAKINDPKQRMELAAYHDENKEKGMDPFYGSKD